MQKIRAAVGSINPVKVQAVENVLKEFFDVEVIPVDVESKVPKQPIGEETIQGAINRARQALEKTDADLGIGIEAGLFKVPFAKSGYFDQQYCAIIDRSNRVTLGCGPGFEYPEGVIKEVLQGKEIEEAMEKLSGIIKIGEKIGAIGYLSRGYMNRVKLTEQAVLVAMIPRINKKLYFLD